MYEGGVKKMSKGKKLAKMKREKKHDVSKAILLQRIDETGNGAQGSPDRGRRIRKDGQGKERGKASSSSTPGYGLILHKLKTTVAS